MLYSRGFPRVRTAIVHTHAQRGVSNCIEKIKEKKKYNKTHSYYATFNFREENFEPSFFFRSPHSKTKCTPIAVIENQYTNAASIFYREKKKINKNEKYEPPDGVVRDDQRLVVGVVEHFVTRGANVVLGSSPGDALPHRAVSRREMVNVTVVQRVPGVVFGQPRRIPATGTNAMMVVVLHWKTNFVSLYSCYKRVS